MALPPVPEAYTMSRPARLMPPAPPLKPGHHSLMVSLVVGWGGGAGGAWVRISEPWYYTTPKASIASATFLKPAIFAPFT
jgi:hypothetical protein